MSEEEKKAIDYWKRDIQFYHYNTQLASEYYAQILLNLIEKQSKVIDKIRELIRKWQKEEYERDYCIVGDIIKDLKVIINECNN